MRRFSFVLRPLRLLPLVAMGLLLSTAAQAALLISVDKSAQQLTVSRDGAILHTWPVSTGLAAYDTPNGSFTTFRMEADHFSKEWDDAPMPHSIFFTKEGHAIHGSFDVKRLGRPASHGCVRLSPAHAATLFALVKQEGLANTKVVLTGQIPSGGAVVAKRKAAPADDAEAPLSLAPQDSEDSYRSDSYRSSVARNAYGQPVYSQRYREPLYPQPRYETVTPYYGYYGGYAYGGYGRAWRRYDPDADW